MQIWRSWKKKENNIRRRSGAVRKFFFFTAAPLCQARTCCGNNWRKLTFFREANIVKTCYDKNVNHDLGPLCVCGQQLIVVKPQPLKLVGENPSKGLEALRQTQAEDAVGRERESELSRHHGTHHLALHGPRSGNHVLRGKCCEIPPCSGDPGAACCPLCSVKFANSTRLGSETPRLVGRPLAGGLGREGYLANAAKSGPLEAGTCALQLPILLHINIQSPFSNPSRAPTSPQTPNPNLRSPSHSTSQLQGSQPPTTFQPTPTSQPPSAHDMHMHAELMHVYFHAHAHNDVKWNAERRSQHTNNAIVTINQLTEFFGRDRIRGRLFSLLMCPPVSRPVHMLLLCFARGR